MRTCLARLYVRPLALSAVRPLLFGVLLLSALQVSAQQAATQPAPADVPQTDQNGPADRAAEPVAPVIPATPADNVVIPASSPAPSAKPLPFNKEGGGFGFYDEFVVLRERIKAIRKQNHFSPYHLAKAQCWLEVSFQEYSRADDTIFPRHALAESEKLVKLLENEANPLPMSAVIVPSADRLRPDLWERLSKIKAMPGFVCAAEQVGCAEVELNHAGDETRQGTVLHALPYLRLAMADTDEAEAHAKNCPQADEASKPLVAAAQVEPKLSEAEKTELAKAKPSERVTLSADLIFNFDKFDLANMRAEGRSKLDALIAQIRSGYATVDAVDLFGHADRLNGTHDPLHNQKLSERRAATVQAYLKDHGLGAMHTNAIGRGDTRPVKDCADKDFKSRKALAECLAPNRRVEVLIYGVKAGQGAN